MRKILAGLLSAGLVVAGAATVVVWPGQDQIAVAADFGPGDGLDRFVVRAGYAELPELPAVDAALLDGAYRDLGAGGEFQLHDGATWYVTGASSRRVSRPGAEPAAPPVSDAVVTALQAVAGVVSAQRLDDGSVLVATSGDITSLRAVPGVDSVEASVQASVNADPTDPAFARYGWNLQNTGSNNADGNGVRDADVDAPDAWTGTEGAGTVVAVIDSGFMTAHEDLQGALWTNPDQPCNSVDSDANGKPGDCHGWNFYANSPSIDNSGYNVHGVMVSGTIAARKNNGLGSAGVAPQTTIMPLAVGGGSSIDINLAAQAIVYAVDNGADVINCSFGGNGTTASFRSAVAYAASKGVLLVVSAGNDSTDREVTPVYPANLPDDNIITVGSSTSADTVAAHSAYGSRSVDLFAPGQLTFTPTNNGGYGLWSGTSDAAPHVAAAVALYRAARPQATTAQIKAAILADSTKLPAFTGKSVSGGRLSLRALAADAVDYSFTGAGTVPTSGQRPAVHVSSAGGSGRYTLRGSLVTEQGGELWGLAGVPVAVSGTTTTTDDRGDFTVDLGNRSSFGTADVQLGLTLPRGSFALGTQLLRNGTTLGTSRWVPLTVTDAAATPTSAPTPGTSTPGTSTPRVTTTPGTPTPGTTTPGTTTPARTPATTPGTTSPRTSAPAPSPSPGASTPRSSTPVTVPTAAPVPPPVRTTSAPSAPRSTNAAPTTAPSPAPSTAPSTAPTTAPTPVRTTAPTTAPTTPARVPSTTSSPGSTSAPNPSPSRVSLPSVGRFRVTALAPATVSTVGGGRVTITGTDLDTARAVRVGDTSSARIVTATATSLTFEAPARVAGVYDVTVFAPDLSTSVLARALTYTAPASGGAAPTPGASASPTSAPNTPAPNTPAPSATTRPTTPTTTSAPAVTPPPAAGRPTTAVGPGGLRLTRRDDLSAQLRTGGALWRTSGCERSCPGLTI